MSPEMILQYNLIFTVVLLVMGGVETSIHKDGHQGRLNRPERVHSVRKINQGECGHGRASVISKLALLLHKCLPGLLVDCATFCH